MANKRRSDYSDGGDRPWNDTAWRPTDEELVRTVLEVDDPRTLANRVDRIPTGVKAVRIEQVYKCSEKLPCAVPGCPALHNKGLIARLSNEQVAHIGHICGEKLFPGEGNWDQQMATLNWKIKRQNYLRRIAPLERDIIAALRTLETWERPLYNFRNTRAHFREFFYQLYNELHNAARSNGLLQVPRRRRNRMAEEMRGKQKGKRDGPIYENYLETYGQLQGAQIFRNPGPSSMLRQAQEELRQIRARLGARSLRNDEMRSATACPPGS